MLNTVNILTLLAHLAPKEIKSPEMLDTAVELNPILVKEFFLDSKRKVNFFSI